MKRIVVIGGGITGLATAHRLIELTQSATNSVEVVLLEQSGRLGGIVQTEYREGFLLEHGPDSFISEKPAALELARRIGLEHRLIQTNQKHRNSFVVRKGRLFRVPKGFHLVAPSRFWPLLTSDIFSWFGKVRIAMEPLVPRRRLNGAFDESLAAFVRRRLGQEALERMAQPMVGGIYTADPEHLSLRATFPRFLDMENTYGSVIRALRKERKAGRDVTGVRYSLFLSFDQGMQVLTDQLVRGLPQQTVRLNSRAVALERDARSANWRVRTSSGEVISAEAVCITLPAYAAASLLRTLQPALGSELDSICYESSATVNLAYKRTDIAHSLAGFGFVVPFIEQRALIACTFSNIKFTGRAPDGYVLLRAFVGGALQRQILALENDELLRRVQADLNELLSITNEPLFSKVTKWERSMPQYHLGHLERIERIKNLLQGLSGLSLAGSAYDGVGIPDCIKSGELAADTIWKTSLSQGNHADQ